MATLLWRCIKKRVTYSLFHVWRIFLLFYVKQHRAASAAHIFVMASKRHGGKKHMASSGAAKRSRHGRPSAGAKKRRYVMFSINGESMAYQRMAKRKQRSGSSSVIVKKAMKQSSASSNGALRAALISAVTSVINAALAPNACLPRSSLLLSARQYAILVYAKAYQ